MQQQSHRNNSTERTRQQPTASGSTADPVYQSVVLRPDGTDGAGISSKNELINKQMITNSSTKPIMESNVLPSIVNTNNEETEGETATGNDNSSEEPINQAPDNTAANDEQPFELLVNFLKGLCVKEMKQLLNFVKRYSLEELKQLSEAELSRIGLETTKKNNFSLMMKATLDLSLKRKRADNSWRRPRVMMKCDTGTENDPQQKAQREKDLSLNQEVKRKRADNSWRRPRVLMKCDTGTENDPKQKAQREKDLSLNKEVKLKEAENAWRPRVLMKCDTGTENDPQEKAQREKEELIRRVRGILNKLMPENFEPLVEEVMKLKMDTEDKVEGVAILIFEKAVDEPKFLKLYASLCQRLINEERAIDKRMEMGTKNNLAMFRSALLDKTQQEFDQNVTKSSAKEEKLKIIKEKINESEDENKKMEYEFLLDEEELKIRRRSGCTVRFIGELFQMSLLTDKIINTCIEALLKETNNEDMLECLCKLLTTVGKKFEQTNIFAKKDKYSLHSVIKRMQQLAAKNENSKISPRIRFMLQDVIDLRKRNWQSMRNEVDTTKPVGVAVDVNNRKMRKKKSSLQQPESHSTYSFAPLSLDSNINNIDRDNGRRNKGSYSISAFKRYQRYYGHDRQPTRGNLERSDQEGVQQLCHKDVSESTQRTCEQSPAFFEHPSESDLKLFKSVTTDMIETVAISKSIDMTTVSRIKEIKENQICGLIYYILTDYLHLASVNSMTRRHLANVVAYLMQNKLNCSSEHFLVAYKHFFELADDLMFDIPELWLYIFEFTGPLIVKKLISINDLWSTQVREDDLPSFSQKLLKTFLNYCTREVGPCFTRHMWRNNNIKWTSFMSENEVGKFIQTNKFTYVENDNIQPEIDNKEKKEKIYKRVGEYIEQLLKEDPTNTIDDINVKTEIFLYHICGNEGYIHISL